jgi:glutamate synthase (NADPH/NADH) small chain
MEQDGYDAVYIGVGAGLPWFMNIPGENLNGVYSANEYLTRNNLMKAFEFPNADTPIKRHKNVAVVGGGNVAMDSVRTALRLGADNAYIVYRRGMEELPARREEVEHAQHEGVQFKILTAPVKVIGNKEGWVCGMECVEMELGEPDASGRAAHEGLEHVMESRGSRRSARVRTRCWRRRPPTCNSTSGATSSSSPRRPAARPRRGSSRAVTS